MRLAAIAAHRARMLERREDQWSRTVGWVSAKEHIARCKTRRQAVAEILAGMLASLGAAGRAAAANRSDDGGGYRRGGQDPIGTAAGRGYVNPQTGVFTPYNPTGGGLRAGEGTQAVTGSVAGNTGVGVCGCH